MKKSTNVPIVGWSHVPDQQPGPTCDEWIGTHELPVVLVAEPTHGFYDCDCACAGSMPLQAGKGVVHSRYRRSPDTVAIPLRSGWEAVFNPRGPVGLMAVNQPLREVLAAFETPTMPEHGVEGVEFMPPAVARDAVDSCVRAGLLQPVDGDVERASTASVLSAWLHITQACNLRCAYCYVHKTPGSMGPEVGHAAVNRLVESASRHGYTTLKLKYAGGEPTLNFPMMERIHQQASQEASSAGLALEEVVLSNGLGLSSRVLDFLLGAGMRLMVSLDGGEKTHDRLRTRPDGSGSFAAAIDAVERARVRGLQPHISITITSLNLEGVSEAVAYALERDLPFNLNFYRECSAHDVNTWRGARRVPSWLAPDPESLTDTLLQVFGQIAAYPNYPWPLTSILDRTRLDLPHRHPCSAGRDYLAIDTDGRISACQMLLNDPWSDLQHEDPLSMVRNKGRKLFRPVEERQACQSCTWRSACAGGCPLIDGTGLHDRYCAVYRTLFPELIRMEGFRLLCA